MPLSLSLASASSCSHSQFRLHFLSQEALFGVSVDSRPCCHMAGPTASVAWSHSHVHTCTCTHMHTRTHTCMCRHTDTHAHVHACMNTHAHTHAHMQNQKRILLTAHPRLPWVSHLVPPKVRVSQPSPGGLCSPRAVIPRSRGLACDKECSGSGMVSLGSRDQIPVERRRPVSEGLVSI